jgi:hypothetical protein
LSIARVCERDEPQGHRKNQSKIFREGKIAAEKSQIPNLKS